MNKKNSNQTRKKTKNRLIKRNYNRGMSPSVIKNQPVLSRAVRYSVELTTETTITSEDLLHWSGMMITGTASYYPVSTSIKLERIGVTMLPYSTSAPTTFSFTWEGTNAPAQKFDMIASIAEMSKRNFYPPDESSSSWWWSDTSSETPLFTFKMNAQEGDLCFMDVEFLYVQQNGVATAHTTTNNASLSGYYYAELPLNVGVLKPVDLNTIV